MPQQQGQDIGSPTSNLVVGIEDQAIACSFTRAGGFRWEYFPLLACQASTTMKTLSSPARAL